MNNQHTFNSDFGDEHPDCEVIGTDISPQQPTWCPPNVSFQIDDFTQEWTFKENSADYIHLRWLVGSVTDWNALMEQAYRVLKPGGWIETYECDGAFFSEDGTAHDGTALGRWYYIFSEGAKKMGSNAPFDPVSRSLNKIAIEKAGFTNINEKRFKVREPSVVLHTTYLPTYLGTVSVLNFPPRADNCSPFFFSFLSALGPATPR